MYDISYIMPICDANKHYFHRFIDVKKYCFLNIGNRKIRIKLLVGPGEDFYGHEITSGWAENITAEVVETPYLEAPLKIAYYYMQLTDEEIQSAKWHAKIDDDTANDVDQTMWHLEDQFDYNDKNYLVTDLKSIEDLECNLLFKLGYGRWVETDSIKHEWEACILSGPAMAAIKNNNEAQHYLKKRLQLKGGYGDQLVGISLKFCKVSAVKAHFLSQFGEINKFSLFNGQYTHIHFYTGRGEGNKRCFSFFKSLLDVDKFSLAKKSISKDYSCKYGNGFLNFQENNRFIYSEEEHEKRGMWSVYENGIIAIAFDNEWHEHSVIHDLPKILFEDAQSRDIKDEQINPPVAARMLL